MTKLFTGSTTPEYIRLPPTLLSRTQTDKETWFLSGWNGNNPLPPTVVIGRHAAFEYAWSMLDTQGLKIVTQGEQIRQALEGVPVPINGYYEMILPGVGAENRSKEVQLRRAHGPND